MEGILRELQHRGLSIPSDCASGYYRRCSGDFNRQGKGGFRFMISVNTRAAALVERMIADSEALGLGVTRLKNGSTLIDAGIEVPGSLQAGRLFARACMGGLGQVHFTQQTLGEDADLWLPAVAVSVSYPPIACMASQYAGWSIQLDGRSYLGSGPARALAAEEDIFQKLNYRDRADTAVLMLEGREFPDEEVASYAAEKCAVSPERLFLVIAPTASLVGSVQIAARAAETGMHKMMELGVDIRWVTAAASLCPLAPVAENDLRAMGRTNDAILYGARVFYTAQGDDDALKEWIGQIPSCGSRDYGVPFLELFRRYNNDFFQVDPLLFSPAQVEINNVNSGRTFRAGRLNLPLLRASLLED